VNQDLALPGATTGPRPQRSALAADAVEVRPARSPEELAAYFEVRRAVFAEEQHLFGGSDADRHDAEALAIVALAEGRVVGAVRCYPAGRGIWYGGRLAVLPAWRTGQVGALLVREAVARMQARGDVRRFLATIQLQNVGFFRRLGWVRVGRVMALLGRPHQVMEHRLGREGGAW
jgi:putative N-acetyltransferase (TIGR04045 family)